VAVRLQCASVVLVPKQVRSRRRDRGFSLIIVFLLVSVMVGVAGGVLLSTQEDLNVSGGDREQQMAFYAAEYALVQGQTYALQQVKQTMMASWAPAQWSPVLVALQPGTNLNGCNGSAALPGPRMGWQDFRAPGNVMTAPYPTKANSPAGTAQWRYCIHNNADDPAFLDPNGNAVLDSSGNAVCPAMPLTDGTGNTCDYRDFNSYITVEGWGAYPVDGSGTPVPGAAFAHLSVNLGKPGGQMNLGADCYSQEGGCGSHTGNAGALENGNIDTSKVR
jgi:hypothetical protein